MNFNKEPSQNNKGYKEAQEKLGKIPTIKPDFHFVINDISLKVLGGQEVLQKENNELEIIFMETQDLEKELIVCLDSYRSNGLITKLEFLVISDYFLTAHYNGPESTEIKTLFINRSLHLEDFEKIIDTISIPENIKTLLIKVYEKILKLNQSSIILKFLL